MNVLIAEDDAPSRLMLQSLLIKWGYSVTTACDGSEAWKILLEPDHPHIVILDWIMPGIEGPEIMQRLRDHENPNLPHYIIITTSANGENTAAKALDMGADDFIAKPLKISELRARIAVGKRVTSLHQALADKLHKLEAANETISRLASTDELTGLHNRRSFNDFFDLALSAAGRHDHPLSLINIDLDNFKSVNDTFGHHVGDQLLKEFAAIMRNLVRTEDFAVRWGGDEFIILLPHATGEAAYALAERLREAFETNSSWLTPLSVTISIGVAQLKDGESGDALICRTDDALYRAKYEGRNRVVMAK
jgi:diguanylate cyclase (GGDEF)-like protein